MFRLLEFNFRGVWKESKTTSHLVNDLVINLNPLFCRSRSRRSSRRHYTRSRSRSRSHRRSRSRSYSRDYRRRHSHSHSPMSTRRRHVGNRVRWNCRWSGGLSKATLLIQSYLIFVLLCFTLEPILIDSRTFVVYIHELPFEIILVFRDGLFFFFKGILRNGLHLGYQSHLSKTDTLV